MRIFAVLVMICLASNAWAEKRVALLIGNNAYADVPVLEKAVADAESMAAALGNVGFETILALDVDRRTFNQKISVLTSQLEPGDTAFVFFAGHGVEIAGENYLLPVDIPAAGNLSADFVASESISLTMVLERIRNTGARTTLAVLDACRDNPFPRVNGRSVGRPGGLGRIVAPEGTFVLFSAGVGQLALDRLTGEDQAANSVFTRQLLPKIAQPGLELRSLIADLRVEVRDLARTQNHAQFPAYYDELLGDFYFIQPAAVRLTESVPGKLPDIPVLDDLEAIPTTKSVDAAMDALEEAVTASGGTIFARVDHAAGTDGTGLMIEPAQVLIFGNPALGSALLQDNILTGLHLPLRILVFSHDGQTVIAYEHPEEMLDDFDADEGEIAQIAATLDALTAAAAQ